MRTEMLSFRGRRCGPAVWLFALLPGIAWCAPASERFDALDAATRDVLAPYAEEWSGLGAERREALRRSAERWLAMDPAEREIQAARLRAWQELPESDRRLLRAFHERARGNAEVQQRMQRMRERFRSLPPHEQRALQQRMAGMTPAERRAFLLGLEAGRSGMARDRARRELLAQLESGERQALESLLAGMTPEQRRTLRRQMANLPAERRAEWVRILLAADDRERVAELLRQGPR